MKSRWRPETNGKWHGMQYWCLAIVCKIEATSHLQGNLLWGIDNKNRQYPFLYILSLNKKISWNKEQDWKVFQPLRLRNKWPILQVYPANFWQLCKDNYVRTLCHASCNESYTKVDFRLDDYSSVLNITVGNHFFDVFPSNMALFGTSCLLNFKKSSFLHFYSELLAYWFFPCTTLQSKGFV